MIASPTASVTRNVSPLGARLALPRISRRNFTRNVKAIRGRSTEQKLRIPGFTPSVKAFVTKKIINERRKMGIRMIAIG